mgnify:CR=1 FL=1
MPLLLTNLLGMNKQALEAFLASIGEKPFRAVQLLKWIHQHGVTDFGAMSNISRDLREKLKTVAEIRPPLIRDTFSAQDGCYKWIVEVESGSGVEMVYIPEEDLAVRLENDVLITENGPVDLMADIPIEAEEIEAMMK